MKDNYRTTKIALIISVISVIISLVGITFAVMYFRLSIFNGKSTDSATTLFWCMISIFFANITMLIICKNKYKKLVK
ncbi:hypothetical protein [Clostridium sp. DL1XJH146]